MRNLRENGFVSVDKDGYITLTEKGKGIAETMYERHMVISSWLMYLGVSEQVALDDACRIEHVISAESFNAIKKHVYENEELSK